MRIITSLMIAAAVGLTTARAADLTPVATADGVDTFLAGRTNFALASAGSSAFASTAISGYEADLAIDGILNADANPWIAVDGNTAGTDYLAVDFHQKVLLGALVISGRFADRSAGTYTLQYSTAASPLSASSAWTTIGTYGWHTGAVMPRTAFSFAGIANVTGVQIVTKSDAGLGNNIQELEAYGPITSKPTIVTQPQSTNVTVGDIVTLSVAATGGQTYQWLKDGSELPGATSFSYTLPDVKLTDAGSYTVVVKNDLGSATSNAAQLGVTAGPSYASFKEAVLADKPIHYYPLDETNGTVAADLGSKNGGGGTYTGGVTLGQALALPQMGKAAAFFDGKDGSFVDLGLFHPGDAVTLESWVNMAPDASATYKAIVARWDGSYEMDANPTDVGNLVIRNDSNAFGLAATTKAFQRGQWAHVAGVFSDGVLTIFLNGEQGTSQTIGGVLQDLGSNTPDRVLIGATRSGIYGWRGMIAQVAIYDKGLSAAQIRAHYRAALPSEGPSMQIQKSVLVSWPSFPPGFVLQSASSLQQPPVWTAVTNTIVPAGDQNQVAVPAESPSSLVFRLIKP
jgi:Concanavalin A-like lectin/glucanases superfamily/Immunoglobulin domain